MPNDTESSEAGSTPRNLVARFGAGPVTAVALMLLIGMLFLLPGLIVSVTSAIGEPVEDLSFGSDLRAFSSAGQLAADRNGADLYNPDADPYIESGASRFVNPPWYALVMIPISWIPFSVLWPIWVVAGIAALWFGLKSMDLVMADRWVAGALLTLAGSLAVFYGQNAFFMTALLAAAVMLLREGNERSSGIVFALVAFKPHLLLGFVVWWIVDIKRRWLLVTSAVVMTGALVIVSAVWMPGAWSAFFDALVSRDELVVPQREVSLVSAIRLLVGDNSSAVLAISGLAITGVVAVLVIGIRQVGGDARLAAALAIVASLLIAPRALSYDWILLLVAAALFVGSGVVPTPIIVGGAAALAVSQTLGVVLLAIQLSRWEVAVSIAPFALLGVFFWLVATIGRWSSARGIHPRSP